MQLFSLKFLLLFFFFKESLCFFLFRNFCLSCENEKSKNNAENIDCFFKVLFVTKTKLATQQNKSVWFYLFCLRFQFSLSSFCVSFIALKIDEVSMLLGIRMRTAEKKFIFFIAMINIQMFCVYWNDNVNRMLRKGYDIITDKERKPLFLFLRFSHSTAVNRNTVYARTHFLWHFMQKNF